jgi:hypothetical protein
LTHRIFYRRETTDDNGSGAERCLRASAISHNEHGHRLDFVAHHSHGLDPEYSISNVEPVRGPVCLELNFVNQELALGVPLAEDFPDFGDWGDYTCCLAASEDSASLTDANLTAARSSSQAFGTVFRMRNRESKFLVDEATSSSQTNPNSTSPPSPVSTDDLRQIQTFSLPPPMPESLFYSSPPLSTSMHTQLPKEPRVPEVLFSDADIAITTSGSVAKLPLGLKSPLRCLECQYRCGTTQQLRSVLPHVLSRPFSY